MTENRSHPRAALAIAACAALFMLATALAQTPTTSPIDPATARADLQWAADTVLSVHPALTQPQTRAAFEQTLAEQQERLGNAPSRDDVAIALQLMLASLGDSHTTGAPQAGSARVLPVVFFAASDAILVSPVTGVDTGLPDVARLERLGDLSPAQLVDRLHRLMPGNDAWVRYQLGQIVNAEDVLRWLGVLQNGQVHITVVQPDGTHLATSVALAPAAELAHRGAPLQALLQRAAGMTEAWTAHGNTYMWRIDRASGTGVFWLLSCVDSPDYRAAVDAFFSAVHDASASRVVLDLRFDRGGNSNVVTAFLRHLPSRTIHSYGVEVRPSDALTKKRGTPLAALSKAAVAHDGALLVMQQPGTRIALPAKAPVFHGDVVVIVNGATFSSAGIVAVMLRDNGLARIAGSPMGADVNGYGDILSFYTPGLLLPFKVSYKRFERPDSDAAQPDALAIDTPVELTTSDILAGRDKLAAYLRTEGR
ncbi:MAG: S41 family peptidase [Deinococcales bacterium]